MEEAGASDRRGRRGRAERAAAAAAEAVDTVGRPQGRLPFAPVPIVSADQLEAVHETSLEMLQEIGMDFLHAEAKTILRQAGADVDPELGPGAVRPRAGRERHRSGAAHLHSSRPQPRPKHRARRRPHRLRVGRQRAERGRPGRRPAARQPGGLPEPDPAWPDARPSTLLGRLSGRARRHPRLGPASRRTARYPDASDKPIHAYSLGRGPQPRRPRDDPDRAAASTTRRSTASPRCSRSSTRPRRCASIPRCCEGIMQMARRNQVVVLTPFTLAGAMAPVTVAGAVAQQNAEALAGIVLAQTVPARLARRLWRVHLQRRHEVGRASLRHARIHEVRAARRAVGAPLPACPTAPPIPAPPIRSTRRRPTRACSRCGAP